jgi:RNA polymerase sigma-70 factor (ECF subfamily)
MASHLPARACDAAASSEIQLVERARDGEIQAFDALVERRLTMAFRLARAIVGNTVEAEDATQEAFISAWRGLPALMDADRFDAWFTRILVNACRMTIRRRAPHVLSIETVGSEPVAGEDPALHNVVEMEALNRAIDRMSVAARSILALYYFEDRPLADVAAILGIPPGTAKWRLFRARGELRRALVAAHEGHLGMPSGTADHQPARQVAQSAPG